MCVVCDLCVWYWGGVMCVVCESVMCVCVVCEGVMCVCVVCEGMIPEYIRFSDNQMLHTCLLGGHRGGC